VLRLGLVEGFKVEIRRKNRFFVTGVYAEGRRFAIGGLERRALKWSCKLQLDPAKQQQDHHYDEE